MPLSPGTRLGPYEVAAQIGVGGMGEVYRATDTKLKRQVAIKILPAPLSASPDRLARFQREAEVLASLNHPNIAAIYGLEESEGITALVMELVEGEDLSQRIGRGAVPIDEALPTAKQIAEALEAAHEQGIVHRDLKPANVKLRADGTVKVLDFGLAKAMDPVVTVSPSPASQAPTITTPAMLTGAGVILGTAAYMSPEQARGLEVDRRSDLWAFGVVLYEMLAGGRLFDGATVSDTLVAVLKTDPDWARLQADTPVLVRRLLRRCLEKDRRRRLDSATAVRLEIEEAIESPIRDTPAGVAAAKSTWQRRIPWTVAGVSGAAALALLAQSVGPTGAPPTEVLSEIRLEMVTPPTTDGVSLALSPDGRNVAAVATADGQSRLWVRTLESQQGRLLARTEGAQYPFWSPDSRSIGFFTPDELKIVDVASGAVQVLTSCRGCPGGTWSHDGTILFGSGASSGLSRVGATGGITSPVTEVAGAEQGHRHPQFLADGRHFLYFVRGADETRGVYVGSLDGMTPHRLIDGDTAAPVFEVAGALVFVRQGALFAQGFDAERLELTGVPMPLAEQAGEDAGFRAALGASRSGVIAYRAAATTNQRQFVWYDRSGRVLGRVGGADDTRRWSPRLSPDGSAIAMHRTGVDGNVDIWLQDVRRGVLTRITIDPASDLGPVWSPDGSRLAYGSFRADAPVPGRFEVHIRTLVGGSDEALGMFGRVDDWSPDGRVILYGTGDGSELSALRLDDRTSEVVAKSARRGQISPDGRWLVFESTESGQDEVYVQAFPKAVGRIRISTSGGAQPRWSQDGREIFYIALDEQLMAVPVRPGAGGTLEPSTPVPLFRTHVGGAVQPLTSATYMVSPDGRRFLMHTQLEDSGAAPITIILNWRPSATR